MSRCLLIAAALIWAAPAARAQAADSLPPGVTPAMVTAGRQLFHGAGICMSCHGQDGRGIRNLAPALHDAEWLHADGSYDSIVQRILIGVPLDQSKTGILMPPRGGSRLTDDQVRAVAAYVWTLRREQ
jgi:mono/diheme cytochrome c family protein